MKKLNGPASVLTFILLTFVLSGCKGGLRIYDIETQIRYDSLEIKLNDSIRRFNREKQFFRYNADWSRMFADTTNIQKRAVIELGDTYNTSEIFYDGVISEKNSIIFSAKRQLAFKDFNRPNIWVLIVIVLATGILGGLAGPRFSLLDDPEAKNAIEKMKEKLAITKLENEKLATTREGFDKSGNAFIEYENASLALETAADDLVEVAENALDRDAERKYAFLLFGIIAAALSFVALNLFNSKILDFKSEIDYFIFAGYCLIGAVFAKKMILQLYESINKKS